MLLSQHLSKLKAYGMNFTQSIALSDSIQVRNIEHARNEVFMRYLTKQEELFRVVATVADNDLLPADWVRNADRSYTTDGGGNRTSFVLIDVQQIGDVTVNSFLKGTAAEPRYFFCDQRANTIPPGLTGVSMWYYQRPPLLWTDPLDLTIDDGMPYDAADDITVGAYERNLQVLLDEANALGLTKHQREEVQHASSTFYSEVYKQQTRPTRER